MAHIQRINLVCLPENYQQQCYFYHILRWPTIIRVAEALVPRSSNNRNGTGPNKDHGLEWAVVAYVLAKIDDSDGPSEQSEIPGTLQSSQTGNGREIGRQVKGHITSLAVLHSHRRMGIAKRSCALHLFICCPFELCVFGPPWSSLLRSNSPCGPLSIIRTLLPTFPG